MYTAGAWPVWSEGEFEQRRETGRRQRVQVSRNGVKAGMKEPVTAIILFAHGSTVPEANQGVARLAEEVSRRAQYPARCAFLELAHPDLAAAVAGFVAAGIRRIVVIPYFLSMGVHVRQDLPRLIEQQRALFPEVEILVSPSLESHSGMAEVVLDRVREALPNGTKR